MSMCADNVNKTKSEVNIMKKRILQIQSGGNSNLSENYYKHQLAYTQAALLKKDITLLILDVYRQYGMTRKYKDIYEAVDVAFESSFIFTDLGNDHIERFIRILGWGKAETNYKKDLVSTWYAGQYIKSLKATVRKDTSDYGLWQINADNLKYAKKVNYLYSSGIITYKVKKVVTLNDLFDIRTNCAARCLIETDRKKMKMSWKHDSQTAFIQKLYARVKDLEKERVYDRALVERYYHLVPAKTYSYNN